MSTRGSRAGRKLRLSLAALLSLACVVGAVGAGLERLADRVERRGAYPFKWQDWVRWLVPSQLPPKGKPWVLLAGPSAAREGLLVECFERALEPLPVWNGAMSIGTLEDLILGLAYLEATRGPGGLPRVLVVGLTPRFLSELPAERPFAPALDRYSPTHRVVWRDRIPRLAPKPAWQGLLGRLDFLLTKQPSRLRSAFNLAVAEWLLDGEARASPARLRLAISDVLESQHPALLQALGWWPLAELGLEGYVKYHTSPYRYLHLDLPLMSDAELEARFRASDWWDDVHAWDPAADAPRVHERVDRLLSFSRRHGIRVYAVGLPEHPLSRALYGRHEAAYGSLVRSVLADTPFLDLRAALDRRSLRDALHVTLEGAQEVSARALAFLRAHGEGGGRHRVLATRRRPES